MKFGQLIHLLNEDKLQDFVRMSLRKKEFDERLRDNNMHLPKGVTKEEGFVIYLYTSNDKFSLEAFDKAIRKFPLYKGSVYTRQRGLIHRGDKTITLRHWLSTTIDPTVFDEEGFHYSGAGRRIYRIDNAKGFKVGDVSMYGDQESEVLIPPKSILQVKGLVFNDQKIDDGTVVVLISK